MLRNTVIGVALGLIGAVTTQYLCAAAQQPKRRKTSQKDRARTKDKRDRRWPRKRMAPGSEQGDKKTRLALYRIDPAASRKLELCSLQAAQRRLAFALVLLPSGQELTPRGAWRCPVAELDSDVIHLIGLEVVATPSGGFTLCTTGVQLTRSTLMATLRPTSLSTDIATAKRSRRSAHNDSYECAVCDGIEMWEGQHYAEFTFHSLGWAAMIGCVGPSFDPESDRGWERVAHQSEQGWMLGTMASTFFHGYREHRVPWTQFRYQGSSIQRLGVPEIHAGTTVGLLVDVDLGHISVYVNGDLRCPSLFSLEVRLSFANCSIWCTGSPYPPPLSTWCRFCVFA
eukprot:COSAG02_NODE_1831_length_10724_cov_44.091859_12_plen_341_part_00